MSIVDRTRYPWEIPHGVARCDLCGKFKKQEDTLLMQAEGEETWIECVDCMSDFDRERHAEIKKGTP